VQGLFFQGVITVLTSTAILGGEAAENVQFTSERSESGATSCNMSFFILS
jgi:hypothetical protein